MHSPFNFLKILIGKDIIAYPYLGDNGIEKK